MILIWGWVYDSLLVKGFWFYVREGKVVIYSVNIYWKIVCFFSFEFKSLLLL